MVVALLLLFPISVGDRYSTEARAVQVIKTIHAAQSQYCSQHGRLAGSIIDHVLLRPLPLPEPERIAVLWEQPPKSVVTASLSSSRGHNPVSPQNFVDWQKLSHSFEAMAAITETSIGISGSGEPRVVHAISASGDFFRVLGVAPLLGRTFDKTDDLPGAPPVTVISYALWRRLFGGDPSAVGHHSRVRHAGHCHRRYA